VAEYTTQIDIDAPPEVVFWHLITAQGMLAWLGQRACLEPTPGGRFAMHIDGSEVRGQFVEVDPPHRVVFTWGIVGSDDHPPGSSTVEFTLDAAHGGGTRLTLTHDSLPERRAAIHARGWTRFLPRLSTAATAYRQLSPVQQSCSNTERRSGKNA